MKIEIKQTLIVIIILLSARFIFSQEDKSQYNSYFESAANEFNVPADILKGISFTETRWSQLIWENNDTLNHNGMPKPYGIMGLWNNAIFGNSLLEAAKLVNEDPEVLKHDAYQNIRGAAALISKIYNDAPIPESTQRGEIESYQNAIAIYCGLQQIELANQHALDIYESMQKGFHNYGIDWNARKVNIEPIRESVKNIQVGVEKNKPSVLGNQSQSPTPPDYPGAKWAQSYEGHWYTTGVSRSFVVVHDMEGYYLSTISYFQLATTQASIHFCINSGYQANGRPGGEITQMVDLLYWSWHVSCWNKYMLGIEHEGFINNPAWYTNDMYVESAKLTSWLCNRYSIPKDRNHIIAHSEWQNSSWVSWLAANFPAIDPTCNTHTDPGVNWNWSYYMQLVGGLPTPPLTPKSFAVFCESTSSLRIKIKTDTMATGYTAYLSKDGVTFPDSIVLLKDNLVLTGLQKDTTYYVKLRATNNAGYSGYTSVLAGIPAAIAPEVLIVNGFNRTSVGNTFNFIRQHGAAFKANQRYFNSATNQAVIDSLVTLNIFQTVDYILGDESTADETFSTAEQALVKNYLINGGKLLVSGSEIAWDIDYKGSTNDKEFYMNYLKAQYIADEPGGSSGGVYYGITPVTGSIFDGVGAFSFDNGTHGTFDVHYPDVINGVNGGVNCLLYTTFTDKFGGVFFEGKFPTATKAGKVVNLGFPFETVYPESVRFAIMNKIITFFARPMGIQEENINPTEYSLYQNYPNPFNPSTSISFSVPKEEFVTIKIYDVLGNEVAIIYSENTKPGMHKVDFNFSSGKKMLASGVYFYQLRTQSINMTKKMILSK